MALAPLRIGSWRLASGFGMAAAAALVVAGLIMAAYNERTLTAQQLRQTQVQAEILASSVAASLAFEDHESAREYIGALRANREILAAGVYDSQGRLFVSYARPGFAPPPQSQAAAAEVEGGRLAVRLPVAQSGAPLGSVYVRAAVEPLPRRIARYVGIGLLVTMAALIVVLLGLSNASLGQAHRRLKREMEERARMEGELRHAQQMEAQAQMEVAAERARAAIRQTEQQLEFALTAGRMGSWELDPRSGRLTASEEFRAAFGLGPQDRMSRRADLTARVHPEDREAQSVALDRAIEAGGELESEYRTLAPDGQVRWVLVRGRAALNEAGKATKIAGVLLDITERKAAEERQRLLLAELNHRVKNTLATVQSIALQTLRTAGEGAAFQEAFLARIGALARAHELLTQVAWEGALLGDVIARTLAPHAGTGAEERVELAGLKVLLGPNAAVTLTMAFHELATNAAKYGALSTAAGRVHVTWKTDRPGNPTEIEIEWREDGGPTVVPPKRRGFGSRLVETGLAREFDGRVDLTFPPDGVRCRMVLPISQKLQLAA